MNAAGYAVSETPTVLLVEDDPCIRRAVSRELCARGGQVFAASRASDIPDNQWASVGIFDCELDGEFGPDIAARLLAEGAIELAIFYTATTDPRTRMRAAQIGLVVDKAYASCADLAELVRQLQPRIAC